MRTTVETVFFLDNNVNIAGMTFGRAGDAVDETLKINPETNLLIDGKLVAAETGRTFENVNPATEEVLGRLPTPLRPTCTGPSPRHGAPSTRPAGRPTVALRQRCLEQLQEALEDEVEQLREQLILEVGCPRMLTDGPQLTVPLNDALRYPVKLIDEFEWETRLTDATDFRGGTECPPDREGAGGRGGSHHAMELPLRGDAWPSWARPWPPATRWC